MTYLTEFPGFDDIAPMAAFLTDHGFEDISWHNDSCPSFECDVFVLYVDHLDVTKREPECEGIGRFCLKDEDRPVLETDNWDDVVAFIVDGRRDFGPYVRAPLKLRTVATGWTLPYSFTTWEEADGFRTRFVQENPGRGDLAVIAED